jgi:hypothetical protein
LVARAHATLHNKIYNRRGLTRTALAVNSALTPTPATPTPGLSGQQSLPGGPPLLLLPMREQPLAVMCMEAALPLLSALPAAHEHQLQQQVQQQSREHGALVLLSHKDNHEYTKAGDVEDVEEEL